MTKDCSICKGSKYCISKPNKNDYKFPEEENQYLIDLECGIWNCHTAVIKLLKKNAELKEQNSQLEKENKLKEEIIIGEQQEINRLEKENAELKEALNNHPDTASATQLLELIQVREENEKLKTREKALGERVLQLEKDKGKLIDENRRLRCCGNCARPCYNGSSSSEEYCIRNNRIQWKFKE